MGRARWYRALHLGLQILQIRKRNVIFQIVPCQIRINDPMSLWIWAFRATPSDLRRWFPQ